MAHKHTPGPWYAIYYDESVAKAPHWSVECHWPDTIAIAPFIRDAYSEGEAKDNAKLIAAAPEMLEALVGIMDFAKKQVIQAAITHDDPEKWLKVMNAVFKAIED